MTVSEYNKCVDSLSDGAYRFLLHNVKNKDIAKDIVQDTFEKLWITHANVNFEKAKSYIFTTANLNFFTPYFQFIDPPCGILNAATQIVNQPCGILNPGPSN